MPSFIYRELPYFLVCCTMLTGVAWRFIESERLRANATLRFLVVAGACWLAATNTGVSWLWEAALAFAEIAFLQIIAVVVFRLVLGRMTIPLIVRDVALGIAYVTILLLTLSRLGANLAGIVATSTVVTAVIGLSLQDTLLNVIGGIVVQTERVIGLGDYIQTKDAGHGWVRSVRTRYTALESSDGDLTLVPNLLLMKNPVTIVGKVRRRLVPFRMSFEHSPAFVCKTVQNALCASPINGVAPEPSPKCIVTNIHADHIEYAAVVYLNRPGHSNAELSSVLTRVYYSLARAGCPMQGVPSNVKLLQQEHYSARESDDDSARLTALKKSEIFSVLSQDELQWLGGRFVRLVFGPGEVIVKQGEEGESLYLVHQGEVQVVLEGDGKRSQHVAALGPGTLFGEMSLLSGDRRAASVIASELVECDRLDKTDFAKVISARPEIAEQLSIVLAARQTGIAEARERLNQPVAEVRRDLLKRIQAFFGLGKKSLPTAL